MDASTRPDAPPQPPKQSVYNQPSNPVTHDPTEQRAGTTSQSAAGLSSSSRSYGDVPPAIHRTPGSQPSSDDNLARLEQDRRRSRGQEARRAGEIDTEYGVEQQPAEGDIVTAVEGQQRHRQQDQPQYKRQQAGAHAGPVGSNPGPGLGVEQDTAAQMDRKRAEHNRVLGETGGKSPAFDEGVEAERQRLRQRKLRENEELDVKGSVGSATGDVVV